MFWESALVRFNIGQIYSFLASHFYVFYRPQCPSVCLKLRQRTVPNKRTGTLFRKRSQLVGPRQTLLNKKLKPFLKAFGLQLVQIYFISKSVSPSLLYPSTYILEDIQYKKDNQQNIVSGFDVGCSSNFSVSARWFSMCNCPTFFQSGIGYGQNRIIRRCWKVRQNKKKVHTDGKSRWEL